MEPHSTAAGALAGAAISTPLALMGAQVDALIVGLVAAIFVTIMTETIDSRMKAAAAVLFSSLLAAYGSPEAASWAIATVPSIAGNAETVRMLMALVIGGAAPSAIPVAIRYLNRKGDSL